MAMLEPSILMEGTIEASIKTTRSTDKALTPGPQASNTQDSGRKTRKLDKATQFGPKFESMARTMKIWTELTLI